MSLVFERKGYGREKKSLYFASHYVGYYSCFFSIWLLTKLDRQRKPIQITNGTVLSIPNKIMPFKLIDEDGKAFTNANLKGHWSMLFFGFTRCPMMCPKTLSELNKAYLNLEQQKLVKYLPQIIFVSVDPDHDTPSVIKKYVQSFNVNFIGITGTQKQIKNFTKRLGIVYAKSIKSDGSDYDINHSGAILIINPDGKWRALLNFPHKSDIIVKDFVIIQKNA